MWCGTSDVVSYYVPQSPPPLEPDPQLVRLIHPAHVPWGGSAVPLNDRRLLRKLHSRAGGSVPRRLDPAAEEESRRRADLDFLDLLESGPPKRQVRLSREEPQEEQGAYAEAHGEEYEDDGGDDENEGGGVRYQEWHGHAQKQHSLTTSQALYVVRLAELSGGGGSALCSGVASSSSLVLDSTSRPGTRASRHGKLRPAHSVSVPALLPPALVAYTAG